MLALTAGLAKSSVSSRFPREAVYGPKGTGGLGISSIYTAQGTSRIAKLQEHLAATTMTGELLRSAIAILKLEIGTGNDIFSLNYEKYDALATDSWIKDVWRYAYENKIRIFDDTTANITLQRESDSFIMSSIVQLGFNKTDLQHINKCRMHLQVSTVSDIACGYGTHILRNILECNRNDSTRSEYSWPRQPKPGNTSITIWRRAIKRCFTTSRLKLSNPLGQWRNLNLPNWKWFFCPTNNQVYEKRGHLFH